MIVEPGRLRAMRVLVGASFDYVGERLSAGPAMPPSRRRAWKRNSSINEQDSYRTRAFPVTGAGKPLVLSCVNGDISAMQSSGVSRRRSRAATVEPGAPSAALLDVMNVFRLFCSLFTSTASPPCRLRPSLQEPGPLFLYRALLFTDL